MSDRASGFSGLAPGVGLLLVGFAGMLWVDLANDTLRAGFVGNTIAWFLVAFAGYLVLLRLQFGHVAHDRLRWLLMLGLGLRLVLLITEPTLSDDVYRYLWEGHLVTEGVSPFSFTIDSPLGDAYDISARGLANNTNLASPYLPAAHGIFGLVAAVLPSEPWTMQLLMIGFDVLAVAMMMKLLRAAKLPERRVLLYWLNPLVIIEVAHGAHIDAIIVGLAMAGLWLSLDKAKSSTTALYLGPALIAVATLTRPLALLFIPVLYWLWSWRQRLVWLVVVTVPILITGAVSGFGLSESNGIGVFGSARAYSDTFRFNSGIYHWFETWVGGRGLDDKGWNEPVALTRLLIAALVAALMLAIFVVARNRRRSDTRGTLRLLAAPLMVYVLLTPVLHPWYTLLLLAFVPFLAPAEREHRAQWVIVAPWIVFSGLLIFSYLTYENPAAFAEREWVRRVEWYPTLVLLALAAGWILRKRAFRSDPTARSHATMGR